MKKTIGVVCTIWMFLITGFLWMAFTTARDHRAEIYLQSARGFFKHIWLTRSWNALHGGVYVPVTKTTQPNPFLNVPLRDITVRPDLTLTLVNPSLMTREIAEMSGRLDGIQYHITSLNPLNPGNRPENLESEALLLFEKGTNEAWAFIERDKQTFYFYMAPLVTDASCLPCHQLQGYKKGDIRGGIRIDFPVREEIPWRRMVFGYFSLLLLGLGGILFFGRALNHAHETLRQQAVTDSLTGIPNRRNFSERIGVEFDICARKGSPLSIIMGDVDFFKKYNDTYGHKAGDQCLIRVAAGLKAALKRPGDFCARYGGEEFIAILPDTDKKGALKVAEKIRCRTVDLGIPHESSEWKQVTLSLGVVTRTAPQVSGPEELVEMADQALYHAKALGRNRVEFFVPEDQDDLDQERTQNS